MVPIKQILVPEDKYSIKCPYTMHPEYLCVHNTANDAPAVDEINYMISNNSKTSFHWAVDDECIVQGIPENRNAFHAGDGSKGKGNRYALSVEICYSKSGGDRFIQAEKNAAEFCARILTKYGWGIDRLTKHQDYSGKYCPHRTLDMGWERFVKMVQSYMKISIFSDIDVRHWGYASAVSLYERGIIKGTGNNRLSPNSKITRVEAAVMMYRMLSNFTDIIDDKVGDTILAGYVDIPSGYWAYKEIAILREFGIIKPDAFNKFRPNDEASRAEIAVMVRNTSRYIAGDIDVKLSVPFNDITIYHYAYSHIRDLYNMGVIKGYENNTFKPNALITRIEAIVIIARMMKWLEK